MAIGVGGSATVAGVAGMSVWIHDGSHYFDLAVAVAMAGFLTLVACVLTMVFGSSHGSQDDAFRRGRSMGYDAGYLDGHRTARPVVVPLHPGVALLRAVDSDQEIPVSDLPHPDDSRTAPGTMPVWRGDAWDQVAWDRVVAWDGVAARGRVAAWMRANTIPLLAGALSLTLVGVLAASGLTRPPLAADALQQSPGTPSSPGAPSSPGLPSYRAEPPTRGTPAPGPAHAEAPVPAAAGESLVVAPVAPGDGAVPIGVPPRSPGQVVLPAVAVVAPATAPGPAVPLPTVPLPAVVLPVDPPAVVPVVPVPVVPLTAAQQTAADAKAAADLTAANAAAAANLTAANAAAAAAETARVAAAAAEATRLRAAADAYAVAHPVA